MLEDIKILKGIFDDIQNESSSNTKIGIIKENKDNNLFKKTLQFVYDDFVRTGLSIKTLVQTP